MNKDDAREAATIHELKTWPQYFQVITSGEKTFEIRKNDRGFKVGDTLRLCNYDPDLGRFTGHTVERKIAYIAQGVFGLPDDVCVMSLAGAAPPNIKQIVQMIDSAPGHVYWGAGEPDCPPEIKARNGELHTLRCKHCDNPKYPICVGQMEVLYGGTR